MSFGNEREFIDYLQQKEGKAMKCPFSKKHTLTVTGVTIEEQGDCLKEECAWFINNHNVCSMKAIAICLEELRYSTDNLAREINAAVLRR